MSLINTRMQDLRIQYPSDLDRDERRLTEDGLLTAVIAQTTAPGSIVSADLRSKAENSEGRLLDVPVKRKGAITVKNVRSCTFGAGENESDYVRVVWKTVVADITMIPAHYANNEIQYNEDLNQKLMETSEELKIVMENDLDTNLDASKSQVYNSTIVGDDYALVAGALQVPIAQAEDILNDLEAINHADNFFTTPLKVIGTSRIMAINRRIGAQGAQNDKNTAYTLAGREFTYSNRITNAAGKKATAYFMPNGSIGLLTRVDVDARMGHKASTGVEWAEDSIPGLPFPVGIKHVSDCSDQTVLDATGTGTSHLGSTLIEHWQISFDFAIVVPYNSDLATKASSIRKFEYV